MNEDEEYNSESESVDNDSTVGEDSEEEFAPEIPGLPIGIPEEESGEAPPEYDNSLDFESHLINPASEKKNSWLNRDPVLSNLTNTEVLQAKAGLELIKLLDYLKLYDARDAFLADIEAMFVISRGRDGFWTKMMRTSITDSTLKGYKDNPDDKKKDSRWKPSFRK